MTRAIICLCIVAAICGVLLISFLSSRRSTRRPPSVPEFTPRDDRPRVLTRLRKDDINWEI